MHRCSRARLVALLCVLPALAACSASTSSANQYETMANDVTRAFIAGDVTPVLGDFAPATQAKLSPQTVAGVHNKLAPLGDLQKLAEDTPASAPPGMHMFKLTFAKATWHEDYTLDGAQKITAFHVFALPPAP